MAGKGLGTCALAFALLCAQASAAPKPDLVVKSASVTAAPGQLLQLKDTTRNAGRGRAGKSRTRYVLSRDKKLSKDDTPLTQRSVPALKPHRSSAGKLTPKAPALRGAFFLIACADAARKLRES